MVKLITDGYCGVLKQMHAADKEWAKSGPRFYDRVCELLEMTQPETVLDYGCGKGALSNALRAHYPTLRIDMYDPAIEAHAALPEPSQFVLCTDVLEHIEPELIDDVLTHLVGLTQETAFFVIHTGDCGFVLPDGRPAHILQRPQKWWEEKIRAAFVGFVLEFRDTGLPLRFEVLAMRGQ